MSLAVNFGLAFKFRIEQKGSTEAAKLFMKDTLCKWVPSIKQPEEKLTNEQALNDDQPKRAIKFTLKPVFIQNAPAKLQFSAFAKETPMTAIWTKTRPYNFISANTAKKLGSLPSVKGKIAVMMDNETKLLDQVAVQVNLSNCVYNAKFLVSDKDWYKDDHLYLAYNFFGSNTVRLFVSDKISNTNAKLLPMPDCQFKLHNLITLSKSMANGKSAYNMRKLKFKMFSNHVNATKYDVGDVIQITVSSPKLGKQSSYSIWMKIRGMELTNDDRAKNYVPLRKLNFIVNKLPTSE